MSLVHVVWVLFSNWHGGSFVFSDSEKTEVCVPKYPNRREKLKRKKRENEEGNIKLKA